MNTNYSSNYNKSINKHTISACRLNLPIIVNMYFGGYISKIKAVTTTNCENQHVDS